jgi:hypothetical protein
VWHSSTDSDSSFDGYRKIDSALYSSTNSNSFDTKSSGSVVVYEGLPQSQSYVDTGLQSGVTYMYTVQVTTATVHTTRNHYMYICYSAYSCLRLHRGCMVYIMYCFLMCCSTAVIVGVDH